MSETVGVLLCGGRSRRMGTDKAFLLNCGVPLWQCQLEKLVLAGIAKCLIACRKEQALEKVARSWLADQGVASEMVYDPATVDAGKGQGPAGAIIRCLNRSPKGMLLLAIDLPWISPNLLDKILETGLRIGRGCVVQGPNGWEPMVGFYHPVMLPQLDEAVINPKQKPLRDVLGDCVREGKAEMLALDDDVVQQLVNWNSPSDIVRMG